MHVPLTPVTFLERSARAFASSVAIVDADSKITFGEMLQRCRKLAQTIRTLGLRDGDNVVVLTHNSRCAVEAHFGVPGSGAALAMLNPWLAESDLLDLIVFSEAKVLIVDAELFQGLSRDALDLLNRQLQVILNDTRTRHRAMAPYLDYEGCILSAGSDTPLDQAVISEDHPLAINFTSGTTGRPKGVVYSHRAGYLHALGQAIMLGLSRRSAYLWTLPMFHVNGWGHIWSAVACGCKQVIPTWTLDENHIQEFENSVRKFGITHLAGSPRLIGVLTKVQTELAHCITVMTGGVTPSPTLAQQLEEVGFQLIHQYGLSETCGPFVVSEPQDEWTYLDADMRARYQVRQGVPAMHAGTGVQVCDSLGVPVPHDGQTLGEVIIRGNTVAMGYFKNPEATARAFRDGWFYSGDIAVIHSDGSLEIRDRAKDLIYIETEYGWENISSIEVEQALCRHHSIQDAAVIGVTDLTAQTTGSLLVAFIELQPGVCMDETEFYRYCVSSLTPYQRPAIVSFQDLPKTQTGKVRKDLLQQIALLRLGNGN